MATTILTTFPEVVASSQLERIDIRTDARRLRVGISPDDEDDDQFFFDEVYHPYQGHVVLHDLGSVLEQFMLSKGVSMYGFQIHAGDADGGTGNYTQAVVCVLHCPWQPSSTGSLLPMLSQRFLTVATAKRVPPGALDVVAWRQPAAEAVQLRYNCLWMATAADGSEEVAPRVTMAEGESFGTESAPRVCRGVVNLAALPEMIEQAADDGSHCSRILSVTVVAGARMLTYFVDVALSLEPATLNFYFSNCFNHIEGIWLRGLTTAKTKVEHSEAVCHGELSFYDQHTSQEWEVETAGLSEAELALVHQLAASQSVRLLPTSLSPDEEADFDFPSAAVPVLLTDATCETQDGDTQLNTFKFTYRFLSECPRLDTSLPLRIHTGPFDGVFN